jgi:hypothetical protein
VVSSGPNVWDGGGIAVKLKVINELPSGTKLQLSKQPTQTLSSLTSAASALTRSFQTHKVQISNPHHFAVPPAAALTRPPIGRAPRTVGASPSASRRVIWISFSRWYHHHHVFWADYGLLSVCFFCLGFEWGEGEPWGGSKGGLVHEDRIWISYVPHRPSRPPIGYDLKQNKTKQTLLPRGTKPNDVSGLIALHKGNRHFAVVRLLKTHADQTTSAHMA